MRPSGWVAAVLVALSLTVGSCAARAHTPTGAKPQATVPPRPSEAAVAVETNPAGDIPDSTQFVTYRSASGRYSLLHPEGWAQSTAGAGVTFSDKEHSIRVEITAAGEPRTPQSVRSTDEPHVRSSVRAFEEVKIVTASLPGGTAVLFRYRANSDPDPVTGKSVRLEVDRYEIYSSGHLAIVSLEAPAGSDNVDVWNQISQSFRWA